ncbi:MAG: pyridine nucleotide-disulfide oxidoreductase, partial [Frankiales bacterium]|nr:pyridine nucleotide-disulfide oxidoreductase [Frankiales bacterium]
AGLLAGMHARGGAELRTGVGVVALEGDGRVERVVLADGSTLPADLVVVGTGAVPATGWLEGSGLTLDDGVVCDPCLQAAPGVWAAGDVARFPDALGGTRRLEHWTSAAEQGVLAAKNALSPDAQTPYAPVPFVWSEWYGLPLQIVGACTGEDVRVVGDVEGGRWVALYRDDDLLVGAVTVGLPGRTGKLRKRIVAGGSFDEAVAYAES